MASLYDNLNREMTIEKGCPWYEAQQSFGAPNVNWCEPTSCAIVNEPANTWSNLAFLVIGILIITRLNQHQHKVIRDFALIVIAMGFLSLVYHATNNFLTQFFDFLGMYLMTSFVLAFIVQRIRKQASEQLYTLFWFIVALNCCLFIIFETMDIAVQHTVTLNIIVMVVLDLWAGYQEGRLKHYLYFAIALLIMTLAQAISQADLKRVWCEPDNLFLHGHAIWHLLGALGMLFLSLHMGRMLNK